MTQRGRSPGFTMSNEHRDKIRKSNILTALIEHAEGRRDMTASQVAAGLGLLKKALPDLATVTLAGDADNPIEANVTHHGAVSVSASAALVAAALGLGENPAPGEPGQN